VLSKERNPSFIMSIITQPGTLTALYALKTASHLTCLDSRCSDTWLTLHKDHSRCHWQQRSMPAPEYKDMHSMLHSVTTYHWMGIQFSCYLKPASPPITMSSTPAHTTSLCTLRAATVRTRSFMGGKAKQCLLGRLHNRQLGPGQWIRVAALAPPAVCDTG
jgi:hypothetical protein